jgi:hypothetical protein
MTLISSGSAETSWRPGQPRRLISGSYSSRLRHGSQLGNAAMPC